MYFSEALNQNSSTMLNHAKTENRQSFLHHELFVVFNPPGLFEFYCMKLCVRFIQTSPKAEDAGSLHVCLVFVFVCFYIILALSHIQDYFSVRNYI